MDNGYSLADIAAATGENGFGGNNSWVLIILFALIFGNGGFGFGNNGTAAATAATAADIQRAVDLNSIQQGQAAIAADVQRGIYEINGATKDAAYNNLGEIRDIQSAVATGNANIINNLTAIGANMQQCCCTTQRAIDGVNANLIQQSAAIQANSTANAQKILDSIAQGKIDALTDKVRSLELNAAMCGVVRYPNATTYTAGNSCYANSCGCR